MMQDNPLNHSIRIIKGIGPQKAALLQKIGILTVFDLLHYFPKDFIDLSQLCNPAQLASNDQRGLVKATVIQKSISGFRKKYLKIDCFDGNHYINLLFFNREYYGDKIQINDSLYIFGKFKKEKFSNQLTSSNFKLIPGDWVAKYPFLPNYRLTKNLTLFNLIFFIEKAFDQFSSFIDNFLPVDLTEKYNIPDYARLIYKMHFPHSIKEYDNAVKIMSYIDFFLYMLQIYIHKNLNTRLKTQRIKTSGNLQDRFIGSLPFRLTSEQENAIKELNTEYEGNSLINRLIQGDVGSGKTVVAFAIGLKYIEAGYQIALMAPTEILAEQHFETFHKLFTNEEIKIGFLSSSIKKNEKDIICQKLATGEINFIIGTHSLIQDDIVFRNLKLIIIDEQHKFGVHQRLMMRNKGHEADLIVLSATPIPRSFTLTLYGDLDITLIRERPQHRKGIQSYLVRENSFSKAIPLIKKELKNGGRGFFIYPVIEEDNQLELNSAKESLGKIKTYFPDSDCSLIHGKMKQEEIQTLIDRFKAGDIQILVATTIVGVGIDVPDATFIVIEESQQFGLSTLHQLRGRIGRGDKPGICIFICQNFISEIAYKRLSKLIETDDGFEIAEFDLQIRGPGELFGIQQSGELEFRVADFFRDNKLLQIAAHDAKNYINKFPRLDNPEVEKLKDHLLAFENLDINYLLSG